jgi:hypothetical protein
MAALQTIDFFTCTACGHRWEQIYKMKSEHAPDR